MLASDTKTGIIDETLHCLLFAMHLPHVQLAGVATLSFLLTK